MQLVSVLIAAAACWGVGMIYYMVLSKPWLKAVGKTKEDMKSSMVTTAFVISFVAQIVAITAMRYLFALLQIDTIGSGASLGFALGAFIAGAWIFVNNAYEGKGLTLSLINTGYAALGLSAAGAILGYFIN